jgi:hypothetical protein
MKIIARFLSWVLGVVIALTVLAFANNQTILSSSYVLGQAKSHGIYDQIATATPDALGKLASLSEEDIYALKQVVDAGYIEQLADDVVPQLITYYRHGGNPPQLDLRDIIDRSGGATTDLSPDIVSQIDHPIVLSNARLDGPLAGSLRLLDSFRVYGPIAALVLIGLIWVVGGRKRFMILAEGMVAGVVGLGILWGANHAIPPLFSSALSTSPLAPLSVPISALVRDVLTGTDHFLLVAGIALVVAAAALVVAHMVTKMLGGKEHHG